MRIAYFGYDFFASCLEKLLTEHEVIKIFTFNADNKYNFNHKIIELSEKKNIPVCFGKVSEEDIKALVDEGCDLIVSAAYPYKIPFTPQIRGINIHPSLLPEGKGPWPLPVIINKQLPESGISVHVLTNELDSGDILIQKKFELSNRDNIESLSVKCQIAAKDVIADVVSNLDDYWAMAKPQASGSYWPFPSDEDQTIDWSSSVEDIDRNIRAYGKMECMATFDGNTYCIRDGITWKYEHSYEIGAVVHRTNKEVVIAASDGLVCLRDFELDEGN